MATFPPPPTYVAPIGQDPVTGKSYFEPAWLQWFLDFAQILTSAGGTSGVNHEALGGLLGGAANDHWHLTETQRDRLLDGSGEAVDLPAVGASPWTYTNITGFVATAAISGGTLTTVEISRDGVTFYDIATTRVVVLGTSDKLRITYAAVPTVALFPL